MEKMRTAVNCEPITVFKTLNVNPRIGLSGSRKTVCFFHASKQREKRSCFKTKRKEIKIKIIRSSLKTTN